MSPVPRVARGSPASSLCPLPCAGGSGRGSSPSPRWWLWLPSPQPPPLSHRPWPSLAPSQRSQGPSGALGAEQCAPPAWGLFVLTVGPGRGCLLGTKASSGVVPPRHVPVLSPPRTRSSPGLPGCAWPLREALQGAGAEASPVLGASTSSSQPQPVWGLSPPLPPAPWVWGSRAVGLGFSGGRREVREGQKSSFLARKRFGRRVRASR